MIELPEPGQDRAAARAKLEQTLTQNAITSCVVRGTGADIDRFLQTAEQRANAFPGRQVVWVKDASLLDRDEKSRWYGDNDELVAAFINQYEDAAIAKLKAERHLAHFVDRAFVAAEQVRGA